MIDLIFLYFYLRRKTVHFGLEQESEGKTSFCYHLKYNKVVEKFSLLKFIIEFEKSYFLIDPHWGSKISWVLTNVAYPNGLVVGIIFWSLEFPKQPLAALSIFSAINVHLLQVAINLNL